jgi:CRISPR/Cas system-associated exonuclease Cas4 (RecB family)
MPGVTSALDVLSKEQLIGWAATQASLYWYDRILNKGYPQPDELEAFHAEARKAHTRKKEAAADIGTIAHSHAEALLRGEEPSTVLDTPELEYACTAVSDFLKGHSILIEDDDDVERILLSRKHGYCGTTDFVGELDGRWGVFDFKTSKKYRNGLPYETHRLQLAAYAVALEEELGREVNDGAIIRLDKETGVPELHWVEITPFLKDAWVRTFELSKIIKELRR